MEQEGCQGGLGNAKSGTKGMLPKNNNSEIWGQDLWFYLNKVAGTISILFFSFFSFLSFLFFLDYIIVILMLFYFFNSRPNYIALFF
jgi:hypothetical protein